MGNPRRLEPRWYHIRLNQLLSLLEGGRPVPTSSTWDAVSSSIRKMRQRRRRWWGRISPQTVRSWARLARLERVVEQILAILVPQITTAATSVCRPSHRNEINQTQYIDKFAFSPVVMQRQAPRCQFFRSRNKLCKSRRPYPQRRISERIVVQTDDVPVPQTLEEVVEMVKAVKIAPREHIFQPGDHECFRRHAVHRQGCPHDPAESTRRRHGRRHACCDTATGPSDSDGGKDGGSPARALHRQNCGRAWDLADQPGTSSSKSRRSGTSTRSLPK